MGKAGKKNNKKKSSSNKRLPISDNTDTPVPEETSPIESPAAEKAVESAEDGDPGPVCTTSQVQVPVVRA